MFILHVNMILHQAYNNMYNVTAQEPEFWLLTSE